MLSLAGSSPDKKIVLAWILAVWMSGASISASPHGESPVPNRNTAPASASRASKASLSESYGALPMGFEANQGQSDPQVKFLSRGNGYALFLTPTEAVLSLSGPVESPSEKRQQAVLRMKLKEGKPRAGAPRSRTSARIEKLLQGKGPRKLA